MRARLRNTREQWGMENNDTRACLFCMALFARWHVILRALKRREQHSFFYFVASSDFFFCIWMLCVILSRACPERYQFCISRFYSPSILHYIYRRVSHRFERCLIKQSIIFIARKIICIIDHFLIFCSSHLFLFSSTNMVIVTRFTL